MARRDRADHYSRDARKAGYSARSVYKLEELQKRFRLIRAGDVVLDVGAAPGSWSQFTARCVGRSGRVVAVDLQEMPDLEGLGSVIAIRADVFAGETREALKRAGPFSVILSDAAPRTTGNRSVDTARSSAIVEEVLLLCDSLLSPGGNFVAKLFQGGEEQLLLRRVRELFATGRLIKPKASRSESFESFLVGTGYRGNRPSEQPQ